MSTPESSPTDSTTEAELKLPPASFSSLITMLATQAMVALGQIPDPVQNKTVVRQPLAKHYIDTLTMLEEKTRGNLASDEAKLLSAILGDLRLAYVTAKK